MITLKQFFEITNYRITEGGDYGWSCYGPNSHHMSAWNGVHSTGGWSANDTGGWSANAVFDTETQTVYEVEVCDYTHDRAYRLINPEFAEAQSREAKQRDVNMNQAWDDVKWVDLEVDLDWLEKAQAIVAGEAYDDRVQIELNLDQDLLFDLMKLAHQQDTTLNQLVEKILREHIENHKPTVDLTA
jgi:hypothetical protein